MNGLELPSTTDIHTYRIHIPKFKLTIKYKIYPIFSVYKVLTVDIFAMKVISPSPHFDKKTHRSKENQYFFVKNIIKIHNTNLSFER